MQHLGRSVPLVFCIVLWISTVNSKDGQIDKKDDADSAAKVQTKMGSIRGRLTEAPQGDLIEEYLGIPFAKPPVGKLRFADPQPYGEYPNG